MVNSVIYYDNGYFQYKAYREAYVSEDRERLGYSADIFFRNCNLGNVTKCDGLSIEPTYHFRYGNCFTINSKEQIKNAGMYHGLNVDLFIGGSEDYYSMTDQSGVRVFIYNNNTVYSDTEGFDIAPGTATSIGLKSVKVTSLKKPYSLCEIDDSVELIGEPLRFKNNNLSYRQIDCLDLCYQERLIKKCDCVDSYVNYFIDIFDSSNTELKKFCRSDSVSAACLTAFIERSEGVCLDKCPLECSTNYFKTTISFSHVSKIEIVID